MHPNRPVAAVAAPTGVYRLNYGRVGNLKFQLFQFATNFDAIRTRCSLHLFFLRRSTVVLWLCSVVLGGPEANPAAHLVFSFSFRVDSSSTLAKRRLPQYAAPKLLSPAVDVSSRRGMWYFLHTR